MTGADIGKQNYTKLKFVLTHVHPRPKLISRVSLWTVMCRRFFLMIGIGTVQENKKQPWAEIFNLSYARRIECSDSY